MYDSLLQLGKPLGSGLDEQQCLACLFYLALPPVNAFNRGQDVDARGKPGLDKLTSDAPSLALIAASAQNNRCLAHKCRFSLDLSRKQVYKKM